MYTVERAARKETKRKLVEAGISMLPRFLNFIIIIYLLFLLFAFVYLSSFLAPTKPSYESGTYYPQGSNSSDPNSANPNAQSNTGVPLSELSLSNSNSNDPSKSQDANRSATSDAMRNQLANPLKGKERSAMNSSGGDMARFTSFANLSNDSIRSSLTFSLPLLPPLPPLLSPFHCPSLHYFDSQSDISDD